jgi:hypothetical protein
VVRRGDDKLNIEKRRSFQPKAAIRVFGALGFSSLFIWAFPHNGPIIGATVGAFCLWKLAMIWDQTTLVVRADEFQVVERGLFRRSEHRGPLRNLDIVGVFELIGGGNADSTAVHCLNVSVGDRTIQIFRGLPPSDLDWVARQVSAWKAAHGVT